MKLTLVWNSVKDSLPKRGKEVLTYSFYGFVVGSYDTEGKWNAKDTDFESGEPWLYEKDIVTHWTELPNPPYHETKP